jgi:hypothetical protein
MNVFDLLGLLLLAGTGWLWFDSLSAREAAVAAARSACAAEDLLLLDDTVAIARLRLVRDGDGVIRIQRAYGFEYSDTGNDRYSGSVVMLGSRVVVINIRLRQSPTLRVVH